MGKHFMGFRAAEMAVSLIKTLYRKQVVAYMLAGGSLLVSGLACQALQADPDQAPDEPRETATSSAETVAPTEEPVEGSAEDVSILSWDMGADLDLDSFEILDPKETFQPDETIYVLLWAENTGADELPYEATWRDPNGMRVLIEESTVSTGETGWYLSGDPPPGGWEEGEYSIEFEVDGEMLQSWNFEVAAGVAEEQPDEPDSTEEPEIEPTVESVLIDPFDRDTGNWEDCEFCEWQDGQLTVGPWPISGAYYQHNIICVECGTPRYYRMAVDVIYEEGPSERGFGFLLKWNEEVMVTAEVTPWQTMTVWLYDHPTEEWTMLQGDFFGAVKPGRQVNRLEVEVTPGAINGQATYAVGVNGRKQIVLEGQPAEEGLVGLTLFGHATAATFDDFEFESLETEAGEPTQGNGDVSG